MILGGDQPTWIARPGDDGTVRIWRTDDPDRPVDVVRHIPNTLLRHCLEQSGWQLVKRYAPDGGWGLLYVEPTTRR